ncbi:MAG: class I SAM-dependent methyltransferase [Bryobacterales bacterium]
MSEAAPKILSPEYYERLKAVEARHPWAKAMRRLSFDLLRRGLGGVQRPKVLDAGCGTGLFLRECGAKFDGPELTGFDVSPYGLQAARALGLQRLAVADTGELPFGAAEFHVVVCHDVLQHLAAADAGRTLREFARVLLPDGRLLVRTAARRGLPGKRHQDTADYRQWVPATLSAALEDGGFEVEFMARVNWLPSLLADLRALSRPRPQGDVGLALNPYDGAGWKGSLLRKYWALERRLVVRAGLRLGLGHTLICLARKGPRCESR